MTWDGRKLEFALAAAGINQAQLAEKLGVEPPTVSRWVNNENAPRPKHIPKIAELLGKSADYFVASDSAFSEQLKALDNRLVAIESISLNEPLDEKESEMLRGFSRLKPKEKGIILRLLEILPDLNPTQRKMVLDLAESFPESTNNTESGSLNLKKS
jgi:transcriptional regulator with XRE-family HTH domain